MLLGQQHEYSNLVQRMLLFIFLLSNKPLVFLYLPFISSTLYCRFDHRIYSVKEYRSKYKESERSMTSHVYKTHVFFNSSNINAFIKFIILIL